MSSFIEDAVESKAVRYAAGQYRANRVGVGAIIQAALGDRVLYKVKRLDEVDMFSVGGREVIDAYTGRHRGVLVQFWPEKE